MNTHGHVLVYMGVQSSWVLGRLISVVNLTAFRITHETRGARLWRTVLIRLVSCLWGLARLVILHLRFYRMPTASQCIKLWFLSTFPNICYTMFLYFDLLRGKKWHLLMTWICISLLAEDAEPLPMCLVPFVFISGGLSVQAFAPFLIGSFAFSLWSKRSWIFIPKPLVRHSTWKYFLPAEDFWHFLYNISYIPI